MQRTIPGIYSPTLPARRNPAGEGLLLLSRQQYQQFQELQAQLPDMERKLHKLQQDWNKNTTRPVPPGQVEERRRRYRRDVGSVCIEVDNIRRCCSLLDSVQVWRCAWFLFGKLYWLGGDKED